MVVQQEAPVTVKRRDRLRAQMRQEILTASRQILRDGGFKELSMRGLAQAVGVTAPTLYDYFPSKEGVLDALHEEGTNRLQVFFQEAIAAHPAGMTQLRQIAIAYRAFAHAEPDLYQLMFARIDGHYRPADDVKARAKSLFYVVISVIEAAIASGDLREVDSNSAGLTVWSTVHGFVTLEINGYMKDDCSPSEADATFDASLDLLFDGLRCASA